MAVAMKYENLKIVTVATAFNSPALTLKAVGTLTGSKNHCKDSTISVDYK